MQALGGVLHRGEERLVLVVGVGAAASVAVGTPHLPHSCDASAELEGGSRRRGRGWGRKWLGGWGNGWMWSLRRQASSHEMNELLPALGFGMVPLLSSPLFLRPRWGDLLGLPPLRVAWPHPPAVLQRPCSSRTPQPACGPRLSLHTTRQIQTQITQALFSPSQEKANHQSSALELDFSPQFLALSEYSS